MSTKTPVEVQRAPTELPPAVPPSRTARGPWAMWIGIVVALVIGGLIGYLIGWNVAPAETVTVTEQVTETVAPPAYTAGAEMEALVTFDGTSCTYAGPAEVNARTQANFTYAASVRGSGLVVWKVASGTTYEQVIHAVDTRAADEPPPFLDYYDISAPENSMRQTLSMSLIEGTYVVSCMTNPDTSTNDAFASTMIRVLPG